jgi:beta-lactamase regulating signal transducer with metallopeptidase domain
MGQLANEWTRLAMTHGWQVTVLIVLTAIIVRLFARHRPHLAFVLWLLVLVKCVTPPVWNSPSGVFCWLQPSQTATLSESSPQLGGGEDREQHGLGPSTVVAHFDRSPVPAREWRELTAPQFYMATEASVATDRAGRPSPTNRVSSIERILIALSVTWLSGAALIVAIAVFRYLSFRWHLNGHVCVEQPRLTDLVRDLSRRLKVKRKVRLCVSTIRTGPAVIGVFRPTVLLPAVLVEGPSNEELKPLLAHELIHVRRGDLWYGMLQVIAQALWWCHPLVWWAGRRASREAERCCDEEVIAELGCSPAQYARSLLGVLELKKTLKPVPSFPGIRPVEVTSNRLERIMKLRQGCRRRTPWWCWTVLATAAAATLPGAAFQAGENDEPIECLTSPNGGHAASIPPLPKNVLEEPLVTCAYEVADLVEKARVELDIDVERAKLAVVDHIGALGFMPGGKGKSVDSQSDEGAKASEETEHGSPRQKQRPSCGWLERELIIRETAARHRHIASALAALRKYGFGRVVIEAYIVAGPAKVINAIDANWTIVEAEVPADEQPTHQDPDDPLRAVHQNAALKKFPGPPLPDVCPEPRARAQTIVEKRLPVMIEVMDDPRASRVVEQLKNDARIEMLASPKLIMLNGQTGLIACCSQRPFVVGIKDGEPQIRIVDEGFKMRLRPIRRAGKPVWLDYHLALSNIRDVETTIIPAREGLAATTLQVPVVAKTQLEASSEVASGRTLVIGGLKTTDEKGKEQSMLVMLRPTALTPTVADVPSGRKLSDVGVNSDAGLTGTIAVDPMIIAANPSSDGKTPAEPQIVSRPLRPVVAAHSCNGIEPPSDDEVIRAVDEQRKLDGAWVQVFEKNSESVRIVKEKIADYVDPPQNYPLIGPAQRHHTHYKCSVHFTESVRVGWPIPHKSEKEAVEVVYIETSHLHKLDDTRKQAATLEIEESPGEAREGTTKVVPIGESLVADLVFWAQPLETNAQTRWCIHEEERYRNSGSQRA